MNRSRRDWRRLILVLVVVPALGASQGCTGGETASPWSFDDPPDGGADVPQPRPDSDAKSDSTPADSGVPDPRPVECDPPTDEPAWRTSNATPASTRRGRCAGPTDPEQAWSIRLWEGPGGEWHNALPIFSRVVDSAVVEPSGTIIVALGPVQTADDAWQTELRAVGPTGDLLWKKTFPLAERPSSREPSELLRGSSSLSLMGAGELAYAVDGRLRVVDTADGRVIQQIELPGAPGPSNDTVDYSREGPMISTSDGRLLVGRRLYSDSPPRLGSLLRPTGASARRLRGSARREELGRVAGGLVGRIERARQPDARVVGQRADVHRSSEHRRPDLEGLGPVARVGGRDDGPLDRPSTISVFPPVDPSAGRFGRYGLLLGSGG